MSLRDELRRLLADGRFEEIAEVAMRKKSVLGRLVASMFDPDPQIGWRAPEAMAEIVSRNPDLFADYIPIVTSLIVSMAEEDLEHFRAGALWSIGRLGMPPDGLDEEVLAAVVSAVDNHDAQVRGMAVWCLGRVGKARLLAERPELASDDGRVEMYEAATVRQTTVGELVEALPAVN